MNFYLLCFYGLMPVSNASTKAFYSYAQSPNYTIYISLCMPMYSILTNRVGMLLRTNSTVFNLPLEMCLSYQHCLVRASRWIRKTERIGRFIFPFSLCHHLQHKWLANRSKKEYERVSCLFVFVKCHCFASELWANIGSNGRRGLTRLT